MFRKIKDKTLSVTVKIAINNYIKEYGEMFKFNLNSVDKSIEIELMLKGERDTLTVNINRYEIIEKDNKYFIKIDGVQTSREWINTIASTQLEGKRFEIPEDYAKMLNIIV